MCPVLRQASSKLMTAPRASAVGGVAACSGFLSSCAASSDALSESSWALHHSHKHFYGTAVCLAFFLALKRVGAQDSRQTLASTLLMM